MYLPKCDVSFQKSLLASENCLMRISLQINSCVMPEVTFSFIVVHVHSDLFQCILAFNFLSLARVS